MTASFGSMSSKSSMDYLLPSDCAENRFLISRSVSRIWEDETRSLCEISFRALSMISVASSTMLCVLDSVFVIFFPLFVLFVLVFCRKSQRAPRRNGALFAAWVERFRPHAV